MGPIRIGLIVAGGVGAAVAAWYYWPRESPPPPPPAAPIVQAKPAVVPQPEPPVHYPVPQDKGASAASKPLPALNDSDPAARDSLAAVVGKEALRKFFNLDDLVRHIVVTIDNLPRKTFAMRLAPLNPVGGLLATTGKDESLAIAPENSLRYAAWVRLAESVDARKLVAAYVHLYPLFQQAYVELGYPTGYFNNRLVQVIDHLLETPEVKGPVRLTAPHVLFEYADPDLEAQSAGRKVLFRMGSENAARVKVKLGDIRRELLERTPAQ